MELKYPESETSIDDMCEIIRFFHIKRTEYTDCTILYEVTFEQLRAIYNLGKDYTSRRVVDREDLPSAWIDNHKAGDNLVLEEPNNSVQLYRHPRQILEGSKLVPDSFLDELLAFLETPLALSSPGYIAAQNHLYRTAARISMGGSANRPDHDRRQTLGVTNSEAEN